MAARSVRCLFKNLTQETLSLESEHLEHGIYTDPWKPPQTIAAKATGEWRTESDGFMTGTEGRCRYRISATGGTEFIDLWWDNPFVGGNESSISITRDFQGDASQTFEGANHIDGAPPPNMAKMADGDVEAWIDAILCPPYMIANAPIANDANAVFAVRRKSSSVSSPLFGSEGTGPRKSRINNSHDPEQWKGLWAGRSISVTITASGGRNVTVAVNDWTGSPALVVQETVALGGSALAIGAMALNINQTFESSAKETSSAILQAALSVLPAMAHEAEPDTAVIRKEVENRLRDHVSEVSQIKVDRAVKGIIAAGRIRRSSLLLSNGVCLTRYDEFEGDQKVGGHLLYERLVSPALGVTSVSERLEFYPFVH